MMMDMYMISEEMESQEKCFLQSVTYGRKSQCNTIISNF